MKRLHGKLTYSNVMVTILAVLVLGGGGAYAAAHGLPKNSVGSKQLKRHSVTPAKLSASSKSTLTGPPGQQGPKGDRGPQGEPGKPGEPAPALWAVVDEDGSLQHGTALSSTEIAPAGEGNYEITFDRNVSSCATVASPAENTDLIRAKPSPTKPNNVFVETNSSGGASDTEGFSLLVVC